MPGSAVIVASMLESSLCVIMHGEHVVEVVGAFPVFACGFEGRILSVEFGSESSRVKQGADMLKLNRICMYTCVQNWDGEAHGDELAAMPACFSVRSVPLLRFESTCSVLCTAERCACCVDPALKNTVLAFWRVLEATRRTYILLIMEQCYRGRVGAQPR